MMSSPGPIRIGIEARRACTMLLAMTLGLGLGIAVAHADEMPAGCAEDAILVFDASGSMQRLAYSGETRMSLARAAARAVVPAAAKVRNLGLVTYGPGRASRCANIELKVPPQPDAAAPILAEIERMPTGGETPLTAAVEGAADVLDYKARKAAIVLITDGDENCGGDPCETGRRLAATAVGLKVHVISFRIGTIPRFRAACLAETTGGIFVPTDTLEELTEALSRVLVCPRISQLPLLMSPERTAPATSR